MVIVQIAIFLVILPVIYHALAQSMLKENPGRAVVAVAASLLAVTALEQGGGTVDALLIPYGTLALAIPLVLLLKLLFNRRARLRRYRDRALDHRDYGSCGDSPRDVSRNHLRPGTDSGADQAVRRRRRSG